MFFYSFLHNEIHVRTVDYDGNNDGDYNRQEREAGFAEVESVAGWAVAACALAGSGASGTLAETGCCNR